MSIGAHYWVGRARRAVVTDGTDHTLALAHHVVVGTGRALMGLFISALRAVVARRAFKAALSIVLPEGTGRTLNFHSLFFLRSNFRE
jgi:hypothetical protein